MVDYQASFADKIYFLVFMLINRKYHGNTVRKATYTASGLLIFFLLITNI